MPVVPGEIEIRGRIGELQGEAFGQFSRRVDRAEQYVRRRFSYSLAAEIGLEDSFRLIRPRHLHRRAVMQYDHRIRLNRRHLLYQSVVSVGQLQMRPVVALRLERIGQTYKQYRGLRFHGQLYRLFAQRLVLACVRKRISAGIRRLRVLCRAVESRRTMVCMNMRASPALIAGPFCKFPDKGDFSFPFQRQNPVVVFQ